MTGISGHNIVIQQSGSAQELAHQAASPKPSPEQAAAAQQVLERQKNTTVQEFEASERIRLKKEREAGSRRTRKPNQRKNKPPDDSDLDPDATGRLLDTTI